MKNIILEKVWYVLHKAYQQEINKLEEQQDNITEKEKELILQRITKETFKALVIFSEVHLPENSTMDKEFKQLSSEYKIYKRMYRNTEDIKYLESIRKYYESL